MSLLQYMESKVMDRLIMTGMFEASIGSSENYQENMLSLLTDPS